MLPPSSRKKTPSATSFRGSDQIQITDSAGYFPTHAQFVSALRAALLPLASPLDADAYFHYGSPLSAIHVHPAHAGEYLRTAFRIWVTEIRPLFHASFPAQACGCTGSTSAVPPTDECLLLAEVEAELVVATSGLGQNWVVDSNQAAVIDESRRPILLHSRMLQEWMQSGLGGM